MEEKFKQKLFDIKRYILINKHIKNKDIVPLEEDFLNRYKELYFCCLPLNLTIYMKPTGSYGQCMERSCYMTLGFENALLVRGNRLDMEYEHGKGHGEHGWIEVDGWVYDPSYLYKFKKDVYYKVYGVSDVVKYTKDDYKNSEWYNIIVNTNVDDYKPGGKRRYELATIIPLFQSIVNNNKDEYLIKELNEYLELINYDYDDVIKTLHKDLDKMICLQGGSYE